MLLLLLPYFSHMFLLVLLVLLPTDVQVVEQPPIILNFYTNLYSTIGLWHECIHMMMWYSWHTHVHLCPVQTVHPAAVAVLAHLVFLLHCCTDPWLYR